MRHRHVVLAVLAGLLSLGAAYAAVPNACEPPTIQVMAVISDTLPPLEASSASFTICTTNDAGVVDCTTFRKLPYASVQELHARLGDWLNGIPAPEGTIYRVRTDVPTDNSSRPAR
jgi:hypothetical protein